MATMRKRLINYRGYGPDRTLKKLHLALRYAMPRSRLKGEVALARRKRPSGTRIGHRRCIATRKPPRCA